MTSKGQPPTRPAALRAAGVLLAAVLVLAACNRADTREPPDNPSPSPAATDPPEPPALDSDTAADLYVAWRETVYALPPTQPEAVDAEAGGDTIVVPGSAAADWVTQELGLARDRGVIVRGSVHAESLSAPQVTGDRATAAICSSADVRVTDVATGDPVSDDAVDTSYTRFDATYQRMNVAWLVEGVERSDERACVPPSIDGALAARWEQFTEAWYERDRKGGGENLGQLADVVTERFADTLRGLPARDPVPDPSPYTNFETVAATPTTATSHACRAGGLETIEWTSTEGSWRVDFAGQTGQEPTPCP